MCLIMCLVVFGILFVIRKRNRTGRLIPIYLHRIDKKKTGDVLMQSRQKLTGHVVPIAKQCNITVTYGQSSIIPIDGKLVAHSSVKLSIFCK